MKHGSLFSGIGGFDLAAQWMGWENVFQVEWDSFCQKILAENFPNVKRYGDIKEFDGTKYRGLIDILTGGFPCQPFSLAGKQEGKSDDRYLWPEMLRVIREIQPPWITGENVPGIIRMELENICASLESEGYWVQPFIIPSASIGAWDKRERVWIIAHNQKSGVGRLPIQQRGQNKTSDTDPNRETKVNSNTNKFNSDNAGYNSGSISQQQKAGIQINKITPDIDCTGSQESIFRQFKSISRKIKIDEGSTNNGGFSENKWWEKNWIEVASELCRSNAGVPNRMDRIKALGNSVNPYVVYQIFKAIEEFALSENKK